MNQRVQEIPNFLNSSECQELIQEVQEKLKDWRTSPNGGKSRVLGDAEMANKFNERVLSIVPKEWKGWTVIGTNPFVHYCYYPEGASFPLHIDKPIDPASDKEHPRTIRPQYRNLHSTLDKFKVLVYLNTLENGETVFYKDDDSILKRTSVEAGKAVIFDIDLKHEAEPVTKGEKFIIGFRVQYGIK